MADDRLPASFSLVASFGFGGKESASKPPQAICKPLGNIQKSPPHKQHIWFLPTRKANAEKTKRAVFCQRSDRN
jgi:hypothetical protein